MSALLDRARAFFEREVAPRAAALDRDPAALGEALDGMAGRGLLAVRCPPALGGGGLSAEDAFVFQEAVARASGALAFLQTQHQSAAALLVTLGRPAVRDRLVPQLASGARRLGIGFSHLRVGPRVVTATPVAGGWRLDGRVAWVTGQGFFDAFLVAGSRDDGSAVFGLAPFRDVPGLTVGPPMDLAAMASTRTVAVTLDGWTLPEDDVAFEVPPGWIDETDRLTVAVRAAFPLGCARAGLDALTATPGVERTHAALSAELDRCRAGVLACTPATPHDERVRLRAWATELAVRCAYAAVTAWSGRGLAGDHPAQRVYREALAFTVLGQTSELRAATLERLARPAE